MCTHLNYSGRCEILKDICYHSTKYCMSSICVLQQMAEEPNCRNTEPHRVWQCCEGFLSLLTANPWAAAEQGRAKGQQRSPKQLVDAPSSPSQESKRHSSKSITMIIYCHSFRHWCVLLSLPSTPARSWEAQASWNGAWGKVKGPHTVYSISLIKKKAHMKFLSYDLSSATQPGS